MTLLLALLYPAYAFAHQPVMDMAPRWDGGYGAQTRLEMMGDDTTTWLEGVYTFNKAIRTTVKLGYRDGQLDDAIIGLPLKYYTNEGATTANWSITPSVRFAKNESNKRDSELGVSMSYSSETPSFYQLYDLYAWEDRVGLDINAGFGFPNDDGGRFALWDVSALSTDDGDRVQTGPVFVLFHNNIMMRAEFKATVYDHGSIASGNYVGLGIGVVY